MNVYYCVQDRPPLISVQSHINPVNPLPSLSYASNIDSNIILPSTPKPYVLDTSKKRTGTLAQNCYVCSGRISKTLAGTSPSNFLMFYTTRKKVVGLERGPLSLVSTTEELLDRKVAAPV
jgi:hypothetical protein